MPKCLYGNYSSPLCTFETSCKAGEILDLDAGGVCTPCDKGSYQLNTFNCAQCPLGMLSVIVLSTIIHIAEVILRAKCALWRALL